MREKNEKNERVEGVQGHKTIYIKTKRTEGVAEVAVKYNDVINLPYNNIIQANFHALECQV